MTSLVFTTVHGSHLYGLNHADSDRDIFEVVHGNQKARQGFYEDGTDYTRIGLDAFIRYAKEGSHQSLEALFSNEKVWHDERYRPMLEGIRVPAAAVREKYARTIKKFCYGDFKRRRHAVRLYYFLVWLEELGGISDPRMSDLEISVANNLAESYGGDGLWEILRANIT